MQQKKGVAIPQKIASLQLVLAISISLSYALTNVRAVAHEDKCSFTTRGETERDL